jgi:septum site-determining protein MinC
MNTGEVKGAVMESGIQLKGTGFGIKVIFPEDLTESALLKIFAAIPEEAYALPMGRGIVLDFQARPCSEKLIVRILREVVWPKKLSVLAWITTDEESSKRLKRAGFSVTEPPSERAEEPAMSKSLILEHSLRSGRREEYGGDVILVGHLNEGAEIFAGGSVFILGRLKGLVHAGCNGTDGVCVATGSFETRQLRVGDKLCDQFGNDMKWWKKPVIITLENDGLLFREWTIS